MANREALDLLRKDCQLTPGTTGKGRGLAATVEPLGGAGYPGWPHRPDPTEALPRGGDVPYQGCEHRSCRLTLLLVLSGPGSVTIGPMVSVELERIEALELLGMTLAHLNDAEARGEVSPRVPLLMAIRDKLALGLREES